MTDDCYSNDYRLTHNAVIITLILAFGVWDKVAHLVSLLLYEQESAASSNPTFEDNIKISTDLASKFCPFHVHKLSARLIDCDL